MHFFTSAEREVSCKHRLTTAATMAAVLALGLIPLFRSSSFGPAVRPAGSPPLQIRGNSVRVPVRPASLAVTLSSWIRVGLLAEGATTFTIESSGPFIVRAAGSRRILFQASRLAPCKVVASGQGVRIGAREFAAPRLEIVPETAPALWVDDHQYRGLLRIDRREGNTLVAVNVVPLEEYVASVVDSEMPAAFSTEARMAQAIVARTYALYQMKMAGSGSVMDVSASTRSQKYLGFQYRSDAGRLLAGESADSRSIVAATRGMVCTYRGQLFCTYYCAACGGSTLQGTEFFPDAAPPLKSVPCNWCQPAPLYRWTAEIARGDLQSDLQKFIRQRDGAELGRLQTVRSAGLSLPGRMPQFDVRDARRSYRLTGAEIRRATGSRGLSGPNFTLEDAGQKFRFSGRGFGHGVGLCQWGARGLAMSGRTRFQIIDYYYPGAQVAVVEFR